jgi:hypothetical protein
MRRILLLLAVAMVMAAMVVATAAPAAFTAPKKCPPGQTATVEVLGTEVVETCRVL